MPERRAEAYRSPKPEVEGHSFPLKVSLINPSSKMSYFMAYTVYILICSDGSYYTGSANDLGRRLYEHQEGSSPSAYTFRRRPVRLVWSEEVETLSEALHHEHQIKGWSRAKKEALIRGDFEAIHEIVRSERKRWEEGRRR